MNTSGVGVFGSGVWVADTDVGIVVFVDTGARTVGGATVTERSHARAVTMKIERNKKIFFMVEFPFTGNHSPQE
jgi:hypothetical protein